jgi:hypothetical protein
MRLDEMTTHVACEAAGAYQSAKGCRQVMYQLAKLDPSYRDLFDEMQATYEKVCDRMDVPPEPVFDEDEYKKSDRYRAIMEGRA